MKVLLPLFTLLALSTLTACGGSGGSSSLNASGSSANSDGGTSSGGPSTSSPPPASSCFDAGAAVADFYLPPDPLPAGQPGDVIRCQPINTVHSAQATGTLIMHLTTDAHGEPAATTGVLFKPFAPWAGAGPRPLLGFSHGTYGQGTQCSSSKLMASGVSYNPPLDGMIAYESAFIQDVLNSGIAVTVTDYQRFATPGTHTYFNRLEQGQANIDLVRAARRLPEADLPADGPLAFAGYSQGGLAAGNTAELLASYAPELDVAGVYVGAPPRDIPELLEYLDGGSFTGVNGYYLNTLAEVHAEAAAVLETRLNHLGKALRATTAQQCIPETAITYGYQRTSLMTVSGETIPDLLRSPALAHLVELDRIGSVAPAYPVLLATGENDDIVPVAGVRRLNEDWCALGATVEYFEMPGLYIPTGLPTEHIANAGTLYFGTAKPWLMDRFNGVPAVSTCP